MQICKCSATVWTALKSSPSGKKTDFLSFRSRTDRQGHPVGPERKIQPADTKDTRNHLYRLYGRPRAGRFQGSHRLSETGMVLQRHTPSLRLREIQTGIQRDFLPECRKKRTGRETAACRRPKCRIIVRPTHSGHLQSGHHAQAGKSGRRGRPRTDLGL